MSYFFFCAMLGLSLGIVAALMFRIRGSRVVLDRRPLPRLVILLLVLLLLGGIGTVGVRAYRSDDCLDEVRVVVQEQAGHGMSAQAVTEELADCG